MGQLLDSSRAQLQGSATKKFLNEKESAEAKGKRIMNWNSITSIDPFHKKKLLKIPDQKFNFYIS